MTFSIAGRCADSGMVGVAVSSSSIAVAGRCAHVRAGVGAVLTQNVTDPGLGPFALELMQKGMSSHDIIRSMTTQQSLMAWRQVVLLPSRGEPVVFSGERPLGLAGQSVGLDCAAAGNLLANASVPRAMTSTFESTRGHLAERLVRALCAGLAAGGEVGPVYSAGVKVADKLHWPIVDLRIDWSDEPIAGLLGLWQMYEPQINAFVLRAVSPDAAPPFGVPGEARTHSDVKA